MAIYRIHKTLGLGEKRIPPGSLYPLHLSEDKIEKLIEVGAISRISAPPLSILPGWEARAKRLAKHGVNTIEDLLDADLAELARLSKIKPESLKQWQQHVLQWMIAEPQSRG